MASIDNRRSARDFIANRAALAPSALGKNHDRRSSCRCAGGNVNDPRMDPPRASILYHPALNPTSGAASDAVRVTTSGENVSRSVNGGTRIPASVPSASSAARLVPRALPENQQSGNPSTRQCIASELWGRRPMTLATRHLPGFSAARISPHPIPESGILMRQPQGCSCSPSRFQLG